VFASFVIDFIPSIGLKDNPKYDEPDAGFEESCIMWKSPKEHIASLLKYTTAVS